MLVNPEAAAAPPPTTPPASAPPRVGVFDSGVGGLSVLEALRRRMPQAELLYAADTAFVPYGDRSEGFIVDRSLRVAGFLLEQGAQVLVVACNTATAAAVAALRAKWPGLPIVGVEPGLKPALAASRRRHVGVLATSRTLASDKFRRLASAHAGDARLELQACPGLADAIEHSESGDAQVQALVERYCAPLRAAGVDVAVLGCTHYPFARAWFERALPGVMLIDTADAVARQAERLAQALPAAPPRDPTAPAIAVRAWSTADPAAVRAFAHRWLALDVDVQAMPV